MATDSILVRKLIVGMSMRNRDVILVGDRGHGQGLRRLD
jgi:hypothetical protein